MLPRLATQPLLLLAVASPLVSTAGCRSSGGGGPGPVASASVSYGPFVDLDKDEPAPPAAKLAQASLKARPSWASAAEGYTPQCSDARALFDGAPTSPADAPSGALVACRVTHTKVTDSTPFAERPDLTLRVSLGGRAELEIEGPEDAYDAFVTLPVVELTTGDMLAVRLLDRDSPPGGLAALRNQRDDLGVVAAPWGKLPLDAVSGDSKVACRLVPDATVRQLREAAIAAAEKAVLAANRVPHELEADDVDDKPLAGAAAALHRLACLEGWAQADASRLMTAYDGGHEARRARGKKLAAEQLSKRAVPVRTPAFEVRRARVDCTPPAKQGPSAPKPGCRVVLELSVLSPRLWLASLTDGQGAVSVTLVLSDGSSARADVAEVRSGGEREGEAWIAKKGTTVEVALAVDPPLREPAARPLLALLRHRSTTSVLPWQTPAPPGPKLRLRVD